MAEREEDFAAFDAGSKRRRRQQAPMERIRVSERGTGRPGAPLFERLRRSHWRREVFSSFGLSPVFRAYLFVGSLLAILAFLLYNESIIRELRDQEKRNVDLYAKLISLAPLAADEQSVAIFKEISINPRINFPIIVTDHWGQITQWNGIELPGNGGSGGLASRCWRWLTSWRKREEPAVSDTSAAAAAFLRRLVAEMDAKNLPIPFYQFLEVPGYLYSGNGRLIVTDGRGEVVQWQGADLPVPGDTTAVARAQVEAVLKELRQEREPLAFSVPVEGFSYLHSDGHRLIVTDGRGEVVQWQGAGLPVPGDTTAVARAQVEAALREIMGKSEPLAVEIPAENYIHYGDSELVGRISRATFIQIGALLLFILVGYLGFHNIKRSEQRSIWVGMAKETAHQLGTPLSSLAGWLELIRDKVESGKGSLEEIERMVDEMQKDMQRLAQIASRFSQIGSVPELRPGDLVAILEETIAYFQKRGPQFGRHQVRLECHGEIPLIPLNAELIGWAFENLFKNAIDAIEHDAGLIEIHVKLLPERRAVQLTFQDNGRGIEPADLGRIFEPGFSTKKRGWGLGLAFVKRIVEEYHGGRISVIQSLPGRGTTFEVVLPLASPKG